uniref:Uncharacterized protein n=1 Tax=Anguilla anguilla TaxID=7936 RepID=A0A0E9XMK6_ANGAN
MQLPIQIRYYNFFLNIWLAVSQCHQLEKVQVI